MTGTGSTSSSHAVRGYPRIGAAGPVDWPQVLASTTLSFNDGKCDRITRLASLGEINWSDFVSSPRLQVSFWLALHRTGLVNIDRAFDTIARSTNEPLVPFSQAEGNIRQALSQLQQKQNVLGPEFREAYSSLVNIVDGDPGEGPVDFIKRNLCMIPTTQDGSRGISVSYLTALERVLDATCSNAPGSNTLCIKLDPAIARAPSDIVVAKDNMRQWLAKTSLGSVFNIHNIKIREEGRDANDKYYWLILQPAQMGGFGKAWDNLEADYAKQASDRSLEERLALAFATMINVQRERVAIYVDSPCDDLRIRFLRGGVVYATSVRCASAVRSANRVFDGLDLDKIIPSYASSRNIDIQSGRLRWIEDVIEQHVRSLGATISYKNDQDPIAIQNSSTEFVVTGLRKKIVTTEQLWEHMEGYIKLSSYPVPAGVAPKWRLDLLTVYPSWASGYPEPSAGYVPMDPEHMAAFETFIDKFIKDVETEAKKPPPNAGSAATPPR